ncbi:MAG: right-handed parallel beta-helix repeat-containing protein [Phycisphaerales bacterium]
MARGSPHWNWALAWAVLTPAICGAQTLFVRPTGSDSNDGLSANTALRTIQRAVNLVSLPGATIYVCPGTYPEQVSLSSTTRRGTPTQPIRLVGDTAGTRFGVTPGAVTISGGSSRAYGLVVQSSGDWSFEKLTVSGQTSGNAYCVSPNGGLTFDDCVFTVTPNWGLYVAFGQNLTVNSCTFIRNAASRYCTYLYQTGGNRMTITGNRVLLSGSSYLSTTQRTGQLNTIIYGIIALPYVNTNNTVVIQNNAVSDATYGVYCYVPYASATNSVTISNNLAEGCYYGTYVYTPSPNPCTVTNNIVGNSYTSYIYTPSGTVDSFLVYNLTSNPCGSNWMSCGSLVAATKRNILFNQTPTYANASDGDFTLTGTVGIDQGTSLGAATTDILGAARPTDGDGDGAGEFDLGPFESNAGRPRLKVARWRETSAY